MSHPYDQMMERHKSRFAYPIFLDLDHAVVLVVGGGRIGARKAAGLIEAGAEVRLVAAQVSNSVDVAALVASGGEVREKWYDDSDLDGVRLVITATGDVATDSRVSEAARGRGIWANAADQPVDCEFILPAITRAGRVTGAISTDGASPALAAYVRDRLAEVLTDDIGRVAETLAAERSAVKARGESTEDTDWSTRIGELLAPATLDHGEMPVGRVDVPVASP